MSEVELQQIGEYPITGLLRMSSTSNFYASKGRKKDLIIKRLTIPLPTPEARKAFLTRARQLKKLKNRTIVPITDVNFDGDYPYLVMERPSEMTLLQQLPPGEKFAPDTVKPYLSELANTLNYAHLSTIVHGNLHPGVIFSDKKNLIQLAEFSLTTPEIDVELDDLTPAIPYMAPERLTGQATIASDQYALAVMVYEWLCGRRPYEATDRATLHEQQLNLPLPRLRDFQPKLSSAVEEVIIRALAVDPAQRHFSVHAFSTAYLGALMGFEVKTSQPALPKKAPSAVKPPVTPAPPPQTDPISAPLQDIQVNFPVEQPVPQTPILPETEQAESLALRDKLLKVSLRAPSETPEQPSYTEKATNQPSPNGTSPIHADPATAGDISYWDQELARDLEGEPETVYGGSKLQGRVAEDLRQGGVLSQRLPGYEERPAQIEMASMVASAINQRVPAIIEAATGTGKSLAYLVPVVRSGQIAIISTANKALQEQLFYKDIPFVQKHIKHFEAALVKGVNNYICLDRVENERIGLQYFSKNRDFQRLYDYINEPETGINFTGDFETLDFQLPSDIRSRVATDSDQCAWTKCSFFDECYVREMRERAERAQIIVVNHTLLLLDAAMGGFLLPERELIILDEAHHLEEEATRSFTTTVHPNQIQTLLAQRMLKDHSQMSLQDDTMRAAQFLWMRLEQMMESYTQAGNTRGRFNLESPVEEGLTLASRLTDLTDSMRRQRPKDLPEKEGQLYDKLLKRSQNLAESVRLVFSAADASKYVYYIERVEGSVSRGFVFQASAAPLDVTSWLKEKLFDKCNVISTSATLATVGPNPARPTEKGPNFAYFRKRTGLDPVERKDVLERILPLTFDYEQNALLYLPRELPAPTFGPGQEDYMTSIAREMYRLVKISQGRAFLLFSSRRMLEHAYTLMAPHLPYPLLKQGDMTRMELTRRFREEEGSVLFGLKSFWEGVDIAGDALSLVVIDKLPFDPPDDPVHEARVAQMKAAGENWFGTYVLPQAVLRLKQGIGRLLRTREDRGVMAILDTRLHTKGYGRQVLDAFPPAKRSSNIREVDRFFNSRG